MVWQMILLAAIAATMYAGTQFVKKFTGTDTPPEEFDFKKFIATVILGVAIGIAAALRGIVPDQTSVELQLGLFAGATVIIENGLKIVVRLAKKYLPGVFGS